MPLYEEKDLLAHIAAGDEKAFEQFFDYYKERFYAVVLKMTGLHHVAEEIVQDVFLHTWQKRETLVTIDNPSSYFFTALYRRVYNHYRIVAREKKLLERNLETDDFVNTTDDAVLAHESEQIISLAVTKLPPQQQLVFKLSKLQGLRRDEVARELHISPHTVKNQLATALKSIKAFLIDSNFTTLVVFFHSLKYFFFK